MVVIEIQDERPLSRAAQEVNTDEVLEHPLGGGVLDRLPLLSGEGRLMVFERLADAVFSGRIDEQTDRHHHQQGHDAFGLLEIERGGQKLWGFHEAKPTFCLGLPFVGVEPLLGRQLGLIQCIGGQDATPVLIDKCLTGRNRGGEGPFDRVDDLGGLCVLARSPSLPIASPGMHGDCMEKRGL